MNGFRRQELRWLPALLAALLVVVLPFAQFHRASQHRDWGPPSGHGSGHELGHATCEAESAAARQAPPSVDCPAHHDHDPDCSVCAAIDTAASLVLPPLAPQTPVVTANASRPASLSDDAEPAFTPSRYRARAPPALIHT